MPKAETKGNNNKKVQKTPTETGVKKRHGDVRPQREKGVKWERKVVEHTEAVKAANPEGFRKVKAAAAKKRGVAGKTREKIWLYKVDCSKPVGEKIFTIKSFVCYIHHRIALHKSHRSCLCNISL